MTKDKEFRDPVFVRIDDTTEIKASVIVWAECGAGISVRLEDSDGIVVINAADWPSLVACINRELDHVSQ